MSFDIGKHQFGNSWFYSDRAIFHQFQADLRICGKFVTLVRLSAVEVSV